MKYWEYLVSCLFCVWFMVLWKLFFFFLLLWTHQQRLKGNFPLLLSENAVSLCFLVFLAPKGHILRSRIKPLFGSTDFQARRGRGWRLGWESWRVWREAWHQAESGLFSGLMSLRRGEHTVPRRWWDLEWRMAYRNAVKASHQPLSLGTAAMLSGLVRREYSHSAPQLWGGLCPLGQGASSLVTK